MSGIAAIFNPSRPLPLLEQQRFFEMSLNHAYKRGRHTLGIAQIKANGRVIKETYDLRGHCLINNPIISQSNTTLATFHSIPDEEYSGPGPLKEDEIQPLASEDWALAYDGSRPKLPAGGGYRDLLPSVREGQTSGKATTLLAGGPHLWVATGPQPLHAYVASKGGCEIVIFCSCPLPDSCFSGYLHHHYKLSPGSLLHLEVAGPIFDRLRDASVGRVLRTGEVLALVNGRNSAVAACWAVEKPDTRRLTLLHFGQKQVPSLDDFRQHLQEKYPEKTIDLWVEDGSFLPRSSMRNLVLFSQTWALNDGHDYEMIVVGNTLADAQNPCNSPDFWESVRDAVSAPIDRAPLFASPLSYLTGREVREFADSMNFPWHLFPES